jgi:predicted DNA-binding transcriptional regulator AlpA
MSPTAARTKTLDRFLRRHEVELFVGLKRTQINELIKRGEFLAAVRLSDNGRAIGPQSELVKWQQSRLKKRDTHKA